MANFIWHDLNTTDTDAAADFYGAVIGWTARPYAEGGDYLNFIAGDRAAGGMRRQSEGERIAGPWWACYIGVDDVDAEAEAIRAAGGTIHVEPRDIPTIGRFAVAADPQGAIFLLLAPFPREMPDLPPLAHDAPGHAAWHELRTSDWESAFAFYAARFGWTKDQAMNMGPMGTYQLFAIDGAMAGGMMNDPASRRPLWLAYFAVADIDAAVRTIEAKGGRVVNGPHEVPGGGFTIQATDPQGALFALTGPRLS
ncbi:MAG TPA: VOC family protein [Sphingomonadaceae bacterium]|jgi:predicted enzyme related to lactoylglutathione lyase|nr:VOC family protein [Sphingomonadaceae bacterium]